jgi:hypothetical protein
MPETITRNDLNWIVSRLPLKLKQALEEEKNQNNFIIGGGFIRSIIAKEPINDIDIFAKTKEDAKRLAESLGTNIHKTDNAYSLFVDGRMVQIIDRWTFDNPHEMMNHFDFTIAQCAIWYNSPWFGCVGDTFYKDLASKRLVYTNPNDAEPGGSLLRLLKFRGRDYHATLETVADIVGLLTETKSVDIIRKLREVDPSTVNTSEDVEKEQRGEK